MPAPTPPAGRAKEGAGRPREGDQGVTQLQGSHLLACVWDWGHTGLCACDGSMSGLCQAAHFERWRPIPHSQTRMVLTGYSAAAGLGLCPQWPRPSELHTFIRKLCFKGLFHFLVMTLGLHTW